MAEVAELIARLGDPDPKVRAGAAEALRDVALHGADMSAAIPALAKALSDEDASVLDGAVWAFYDTVSHGTDITISLPALVKLLSNRDDSIQVGAAWVLELAVANEKSRDAAFSALAKGLSYEHADARNCAAKAFTNAIERCASIVALGAVEAKLREEYGALREKYRYGKEAELAGIGLGFSGLMNKIAKTRDALAAKHDILLADMPKPPKSGTKVYQRMREIIRIG
jgi:hypothetical protein